MAHITGATAPADLSKKTIQEFSSDFGIDGELLAAVLESLAKGQLLSKEPTALSADETSFLEAHSGAQPNHRALIEARIRNEVQSANERNEAITVKEASNFLHVSESRIRHRLSDGSLYALKSDGRGVERKLPRWQFPDGKEVPHLGEVLSALPDDFMPLDVKAFFLNARIDHPTSDETFSVRDWLVSGGDPDEAIALATEHQYVL